MSVIFDAEEEDIMKRTVIVVCALAIVSFFVTNVVAAAEMNKMETETGKVIAVDQHGTAMTLLAKVGKEVMDVGVIVDGNTVVKANGKPATLRDIAVGDVVTVRYLKSDDLYAKEIVKR